MKSLLLCSILPIALCPALIAAEQVRTPIDNPQAKVLDVTVQPNEKTRPHEHRVNRVMVYLNAGTQHFEFPGGRSSDLTWKAGEPKWSPAAGTHVAEITSAKPVRIIEIELKQPGAGKSVTGVLDPVKIDPKHYQVEFENDQVRVVRVRIGPGETAPLHEHRVNRVAVFLTEQNFRVTSADGKVDMPKRKAGEAVWGTPVKHEETNVGSSICEILMVELKSAQAAP